MCIVKSKEGPIKAIIGISGMIIQLNTPQLVPKVKYLLESEVLFAVVVNGRGHTVIVFGAHHSSKKFPSEVLFVVFSQFPHDNSAKGRIVNETISLHLID